MMELIDVGGKKSVYILSVIVRSRSLFPNRDDYGFSSPTKINGKKMDGGHGQPNGDWMMHTPSHFFLFAPFSLSLSQCLLGFVFFGDGRAIGTLDHDGKCNVRFDLPLKISAGGRREACGIGT